MGFLVLLLLCALVLIDQYRSFRKIILFEKYSRLYICIMRIVSFLFIAWGIFFLQDIAFIFITILIAIIIWLHPYTTGLGQNEIVYRQNVGGFGSLSPKTQSFQDITNHKFIKKDKGTKVIFNIRNQFQIQMVFNIDDEGKINELLHNQ